MHRDVRFLACAAVLAAALPSFAAPLDLVADAVLGKPNLATGGASVAAQATFARPSALAEDPVSGALWVADAHASRVLRFASAAAFANGEAANLVLGQADFTSGSCNRGGSVAANTLCGVYGLATDQAGRVYVSDYTNHRLLVFRPPFANGMAASVVLGQADFTSNSPNRGGAVSDGTLSGPRGLALATNGDLFVADQGNHRVLRFTGFSQTGATADKVFGQPNFTTGTANTGGIGATSMYGTVDVKVDGAGNLWVAEEFGNRVTRFDGGANNGDTIADLVLCQAGFTTAAAATTASTCNVPVGVAIDAAGAAYVADYGNSRILRYTNLSNGAAATAVAGQASFTTGLCNRGAATPGGDSLCRPLQPIIDRAGNLLVADGDNDRVLRFDQPRNRPVPVVATLSPATMPVGGGAFTLTVTGTGFHGDSVVNWNGSPRPTQHLASSRLLAGITAGDLASAGPYAVTVTNPAPGGGTSTLLNVTSYVRAPLDGAADRVLGQPDFAMRAITANAIGDEQVGFFNAAVIHGVTLYGAALDPRSGRFFISNMSGGHRVMSWPSVTSFHNGQSADVILGQPDEFSGMCEFNTPTAATQCSPYGLTVDAAGALYVADISFHRVLKYVPPFTTGMAASRVFGQGGSFTTRAINNGGVSANSLSGPRSVASGAAGLFILDSDNNRVLLYPNPDASSTATVAIGQPDLVSNASSAVSANRLSFAQYIALDAAGRLFVSDSGGHRILRFSPPFTTNMSADLVIGQGNFTASASATSATRLSFPSGLAFDPAGNLLVADSGNNRILRYVAPFSSGMAATGVLGQADFVTSTSGISTTKFWFPTGVAIDWVGNLYVGDINNYRLLAFDRPFAFATDPAGDTDRDGIPNGIEAGEGRDAFTKDNDIFTASPPGPRLFAMQQYRDFLSREGDTGGIAYWIAQLAGPQTRAQAIQGFFTSPEFQGVIAPVARLYFANFLRYPDYDGLQFHVARSRTGTALDVIANDFATSPEFISRYGALNNDAFVELVYQNVLGRPSDPGGKAFWLSQMAGGFTRGQVMLGFSESPEYVAAIGNEVFITMMYVGMLRRAPDPTGFGFWLTQLDGGTSSLALTQGFLDAPEYRGRFLP